MPPQLVQTALRKKMLPKEKMKGKDGEPKASLAALVVACPILAKGKGGEPATKEKAKGRGKAAGRGTATGRAAGRGGRGETPPSEG